MESLLKKSNGKWQEIYKCSELQRRGKLEYKGQNYCTQEYYAMRFCESEYLNKFLNIEPEKRTSYKVDNHFGQADIEKRYATKNKKMNYNEKLLARAMYNDTKSETPFGKIIDYEVPLKASLDKSKKDGETVTVNCSPSEIVNWALKYSDRVEVLEPQIVRVEIRERVRALTKMYVGE